MPAERVKRWYEELGVCFAGREKGGGEGEGSKKAGDAWREIGGKGRRGQGQSGHQQRAQQAQALVSVSSEIEHNSAYAVRKGGG